MSNWLVNRLSESSTQAALTTFAGATATVSAAALSGQATWSQAFVALLPILAQTISVFATPDKVKTNADAVAQVAAPLLPVAAGAIATAIAPALSDPKPASPTVGPTS